MQRISLWSLRCVGLLLLLAIASPAFGQAANGPVATVFDLSALNADHDGVIVALDGTLHLATTTGATPAAFGSYQRYGFYLAPPEVFATPASHVALAYQANVPTGSALIVALRGSSDGKQWLPWETNLANGTSIEFAQPVQAIQYRLALMGSAEQSPSVVSVDATPVDAPAQAAAGNTALQRTVPAAASDATAPTYRIRATRMGMVGGRTANGYVIQPHAHFVSLPSWRSLSSRNGNEYQVRITYQGRSTVAPVWDVGPWNAHDDYWAANRERYADLPRGWPQDHAAYYDGYNGGRAEKGYVNFPTAIDVGDGVWRDELGIVGDQAEVEVTFLWLGRDPLAEPAPPDPNANEFTVDEHSSAFAASGAGLNDGPQGCGDGDHAYWAGTTTNPADATTGTWQPQLPAAQYYDVYVHVPQCPGADPAATEAHYRVQHRDGEQDVVVNQRNQTGWVLLGRFPFVASDDGFVALSNQASAAGQSVWFDQAKWVRADPPPQPTPQPTPQPAAPPQFLP